MGRTELIGVIDALREEVGRHLRVEVEIGGGLREGHRLEVDQEFVLHVAVSNARTDPSGGLAKFRNVKLFVRGTRWAELLTWDPDHDPPLLLAEELERGDSVSTTVRLRALGTTTVSPSRLEDLADVRVEADIDLEGLPGTVERRLQLTERRLAAQRLGTSVTSR